MAALRKYDFATAEHGYTKAWKHRQLRLKQIISYLEKERRIDLTMAEFAALDKDKRAEIKNGNPAFLGGFFKGRRTSVTVKTRSIVALDIDKKFSGDFVAYMQEHSPYPYYIYETLSSTKKHRKYRVLFFLSDDVPADHYEPLARRIAAQLKIIDFVDHTCYRKTQIMYAPVFCKDVKQPVSAFVGDMREPNINAEELTQTFKNIMDLGEWDAAKDEGPLRQQNRMTLSDPREKGGIIGAFCEFVGDIHNAINMYGLPYHQESENRYSYTGGTSSNGFVVYDNGQWGYSNHESDPAAVGGHDLNAFDLVRVHKFGDKDKPEGYRDPTRAPSFKALSQALSEDAEFMEALNARKADTAIERFGDIEDEFGDVLLDDNEATEDDLTPREQTQTRVSKRRIVINGKSYKIDPKKDKRLGAKLRKFEKTLIRGGENGLPISNKTNLYKAVKNHPLLADRILFDDFTRRLMYVGKKPWPTTEGDQWNENDDFMLATFLEAHDLKQPIDMVAKAAQQIAQEPGHRFNSLANFFTYHLPAWDGKPRIDTLFHDAFNSANTEINTMIARKTLLGGLERALNPEPSEVKAVPVLQGPQSVGKSTFWRLLAIKREWFNDSKIDIGNKDGLSILGGTFIVEFGEFASIKRADRDEVKQFLSSSLDKYRPSYGKSERTFVRHNIFVGSVNDEQFLNDPTGNTRYKVVHTPGDETGAERVVKLLTKDYVLQLWVEAMHLRAQGESYLYSAHEDAQTERVARQHTKEGAFDELILAYVTAYKPKDWETIVEDYERTEILKRIVSGAYSKNQLVLPPAEFFTARQLREALGISDRDEPKYRQQIAAILRNIEGLRPCTRKIGGVAVRGYDYLTVR